MWLGQWFAVTPVDPSLVRLSYVGSITLNRRDWVCAATPCVYCTRCMPEIGFRLIVPTAISKILLEAQDLKLLGAGIIGEPNSPQVERVVEWQQVEKIRTNSGTGSGLLQAKLKDEGWVDLLRYSNGLAGRFHKESRHLEQLRESEHAHAALAQSAPPFPRPVCRKAGRGSSRSNRPWERESGERSRSPL
jgi:hypothetical protein